MSGKRPLVASKHALALRMISDGPGRIETHANEATGHPGPRLDRRPSLHRTMKAYDEFSLLRGNADEYGVPWAGRPAVERVLVRLTDGRAVSAIRWGRDGTDPEIVLVHGGGQNAHTWDTVALAIDRPLLAIDLPGHGRSDWRGDATYSPISMAADLAAVIAGAAPKADLVCGMSLGGLTSICLAANRPDLVRRLSLVDVTPGVNREKARDIIDFIRGGPEAFTDFDEILSRTVLFNPTRSEESLRRGILHNAHEQEDGSWTWRYDRRPREGILAEGDDEPPIDASPLWDLVSEIEAPIQLLVGSLSPVVGPEDIDEMRRRQPDVKVIQVDGAGHSIQGDKPIELAGLLDEWSRREL